jgi:hypothetical protein
LLLGFVLLGAFGLLAPGIVVFVNCDAGNLAPFGFVGFDTDPLSPPEVPEPLVEPAEPPEFEPAPLPAFPAPPKDLIYATRETSCSSVTCPLNVGIIGW